MAKFALTVSLAILVQVTSVLAAYTEDKCIKGEFHKASPSPETAAFKACHAFKDSSCCKADFTVELMANETRNLYNHSWHRCGQLSEKCQQFWVTQVAIIFRRFTLARIAATGLSSQDRTDPPFARTKAIDTVCSEFGGTMVRVLARPNEPDTLYAAKTYPKGIFWIVKGIPIEPQNYSKLNSLNVCSITYHPERNWKKKHNVAGSESVHLIRVDQSPM